MKCYFHYQLFDFRLKGLFFSFHSQWRIEINFIYKFIHSTNAGINLINGININNSFL